MPTAMETMLRTDMRRRRADVLTAAVMRNLYPRIDATHPDSLPHEITKLVHEALCEVFCEEGVEVMTDFTRAEAGLPARGPDGWTAAEMAVLERSRLEALMRPISMILPAGATKAEG